jgi:predicted secreted acid phosphatase
MKKIKIITTLLSLLLLIGCGREIENLSTAKNDVRNYYESGQYDSEMKEIIDDAIDELSDVKLKDSSAVIFDVDDTALIYYKQAEKIDFGFIPELLDKWIRNEEGEVIPQTKRFYDWLVKKNVHIIFLTGRKDDICQVTYENLIKAGFTKFDRLICREPSEYKISAVEYKQYHRKRLAEEGYDIIACIGDQRSDLVGGYTGLKIKVPNYIYLIP